MTKTQTDAARGVTRVPVSAIVPNPRQPRQGLTPESVASLARSIRLHGLLSPLLVRPLAPQRYELIAGERRLRALQLLEKPFAEVIVLGASAGDSALLALVENLQREDLHYLDVAEACRRILNEQGITQERLAASLSCSPSALANRLRLLKLSPPVRDELRRGALTERHARALLRLPTAQAQLALAAQAARERWSVKQLEARVKRFLEPPRPAKPPTSPLLRDNRLIINALMDTVRQLTRLGVPLQSRVEPLDDRVEVIVSIPAPARTERE